jgi:hypothetical protein
MVWHLKNIDGVDCFSLHRGKHDDPEVSLKL